MSDGDWLRQKVELDYTDFRNKWRSTLKDGLKRVEEKLVNKAYEHYLQSPDDTHEQPLLDGKLAFMGLHGEDDKELNHLKRKVIGNLKIRVKSLTCEDIGKAYFDLTLEGETVRSPIAFQQDGNLFLWEMEVRLPVTDITGTFCIEVFSSSLLSPKDKSMGGIIVPFFALLNRGERKARNALYVLYPSLAQKGVPGHRKSMGTGFNRDCFDEAAYLTVRHELELFEDSKILWPLYLENRRSVPKHMKPRADTEDTVRSLGVPQELLRSVNELKRNRARIETALAEILNSLPILLLLYLRSWKNPILTGSVCILTLLGSRYLHSWSALFFLFGIICVLCVLSKKSDHENSNWVVFNDEIDQDADSKLTTVQRLAKLARRFDDASALAGIIATLLEKLVNAWNFSDPIVTTIILQGLFFIVCGVATVTYFAHLLDMSLLGPVLVALVIIPVPHGSGLFSWFKQSLLSLFDRIPTHDDLGRIWIAKKQTIQELD